MKNKKVFLTGEKNVGKSFCINEIIKECQLSTCGFQTLPFYEQGIRKGFYLHAFIDVEENDQRFSIQYDTYNEVIPGIFDTFGTEILRKSRQLPSHVLILDEIGRLEKDEQLFLSELKKSIAEKRDIFGVLKKCEIQYIQEIKMRDDVVILDFDKLSYQDIKASAKRIWEDRS